MKQATKLLALILALALLSSTLSALGGLAIDAVDIEAAPAEIDSGEIWEAFPIEGSSEDVPDDPVAELEPFALEFQDADEETLPEGEEVLIDLAQEEASGEESVAGNPVEEIAEAEVASIEWDEAELTLGVGERGALGWTCAPAEGQEGLPLPIPCVESDCPEVAVYDPLTGEVEALAPGRAILTAACGACIAACEVTVLPAPDWIRFSRENAFLRPGEALDLRTLLELPEGCRDAVTFEAGEGCAVDEDGSVTGTGYVTARTYNGLTAGIEIIDPDSVRTVRISREVEVLRAGNAYPLRQLLTLDPEGTDEDYAAIDVEILDPSVAGLDESGAILARAAGTTTLVATLKNGNAATAALTVLDEETAAALEDIAQLAGQFAAGDNPRAVSIDDAEIIRGLDAVRGHEFAWTSQPIRPAFTLTYKGTALVKNRDYCVQYRNNVDPGTAGILISGLGTYTGTYAVTFRILPRPEVYLKPESLQLGVGETYALAASDPGAQFASSNKKVAAVNAKGVVKGLKKGRATIAMRTSDGKTLTCAVTVKAKPTKVALSSKKLTLGIGQARALSAKLKPSGCKAGVTWSSSNPAVATVDNGTIIPLSPGKATITARTYNGKKASCALVVKAAPTGVSFAASEVNLNVKKKAQLKVVLSPSGAMNACTFTSSDPSVAAVNAAGKVVGKKAGTATITVKTYNGHAAECTVRVWKAPSKVAVSRKTATMAVGMTLQLSSSVSPAGANPAVTWATSNKKIATVDRNGLVTAKKAGKVKIGVKTSNGKKAYCKITVYAKPTSIAVRAAKTTLYIGESTTATATLSKKSYSPIEWYADGDAVTVDASGHIAALNEGVATVYARATAAPGVIGKVTITVRSALNVKGAFIDISKWQGTIDFKALKPAVSVVVARACNNTTLDTMFNTYAAGMNAQGIPFGVYCYSKASTAAEAQLEARALYAYASKYKPRFYVMDAEEGSITQAAILAFVAELRNLGATKVGAYVGHHRYTQYGMSSIKSKLDFVWIPRYGSNDGTLAGSTKPDYPCDVWQYTSNGKVPGISGRVDMSVITGTGKSLAWFAG